MKRVLSIVLAVVMLCSSFAGLQIPAIADDLPSSGSCGDDVTYTFDSSTGLLTISGGGEMTNYYGVGSSPFCSLSEIKTVVINSGVTNIGNYAFYGCSELTNITIPDSVTSIGDSAFRRCTNLKELTMPCSAKMGVTYNTNYGSTSYDKTYTQSGGPFSGCTNIEKITLTKGNGSMMYFSTSKGPFNSIPTTIHYDFTPWYTSRDSLTELILEDGIRTISQYAFHGCTNITSITIPDSITNIGDYAFQNCSGLSEVFISQAISNIGQYAFNGCTALLRVIIPDSLTTLGDSAFEGCAELKSVVIGNGLSSIPQKAFYGNTKLSSVVIGSSVTSIKASAFYNCSKLTTLIIPASAGISSSSTFYNCKNITDITVTPGNGKMYTYNASSYAYTPWYISRNSLDNITLKDGIKTIAAYSFYNNSSINSITIPSTVTDIYNMAFNGANNLGDIFILNEDCNIYDTEETLPVNTVIHGVPGGLVQEYAQEYSRTFECLEHTLETQAAKDPTCTETGLTEGSHCTVCGKVLSVQETIDALGHDYGNGIVTKEPTCILNGKKTFTCSRCGDTYTETIDALGHTYDSGIITRPATCSQKGEREYTCVVCGDKYTEEIAMTEHTPEIDSAVAATCEKAGLTEGSHCSVCGKVLIAQEVVNATGHSFNSTITTPATCTAKGIRTYICSICGDSYNEEIDMISHMPAIDVAVAATCIKTGLTEGSHCSVCGKVLTAQKVINSTGHSYVKEVTAPTCKYGGYTTYTCSVCGDSYKADYTEVTTNHNYKSTVTTPATCTKEGVRTYTCSICGDMYTTAISMTSHKSVTDKAVTPTCTKVGLTIGSHCSVCGTVLEEQQIIPANGHSYTTEVTAPTCKTNGYTTHTCSVCGDRFKDSYVDKTDEHSFNAVITKQATCTKTGVKTFTCSVCGYYYTETLPLIEHTEVIDEAVAPTCTKTGLSQGTRCDVCGKVLQEQAVIPANGHSVETIPAKAVSCTESGQTEGQYCTVCGEVLKEQIELPALGHSWSSWQIMTAPTCEKTGLSMRMCNNCSQIDKLTIPALEHSFSMQTVTATCTHAGYTTYTCDDCGYSYIGDFVPMAEHTYIDTVIEPTTESQGYTVHTCKDCGYSYVDSITDILPSQMHYIIPSLADISTTITIKSDENEYAVTAENGVFELDNIKGDVYRVYAKQKNSLTVCIGEYDTKSGEVVYADVVEMPLGDVNGDSVIDIADLSVLLAKGNYGEENTDIDLTGDGTITIDDIAVALQTNSYGKKSANIV